MKLIAITGPSGAGKSYIVDKIIEKKPELFHIPKSYTDRGRRANEKDDHHIFVSRHEFNDIVKAQTVLAYAEYGEDRYCTTIENLHHDKLNVRVLNPIAIAAMKKLFLDIELCTMYIDAKADLKWKRIIEKINKTNIIELTSSYQEALKRLERNLGEYKYDIIKSDITINNTDDIDIIVLINKILNFYNMGEKKTSKRK